MTRPLTDREARLVEGCKRGLRGRELGIFAGYSPKTAGVAASKALRRAPVREALGLDPEEPNPRPQRGHPDKRPRPAAPPSVTAGEVVSDEAAAVRVLREIRDDGTQPAAARMRSVAELAERRGALPVVCGGSPWCTGSGFAVVAGALALGFEGARRVVEDLGTLLERGPAAPCWTGADEDEDPLASLRAPPSEPLCAATLLRVLDLGHDAARALVDEVEAELAEGPDSPLWADPRPPGPPWPPETPTDAEALALAVLEASDRDDVIELLARWLPKHDALRRLRAAREGST